MAANRAREKVCGGRCDHDEIRGARQLDVIERMPRSDQRRMHRPSGQRLERDVANELTGRPRQHDVDFGAGLREQPGEPRRLVRRDAAGNPEKDALTIEGTHEGRG